jgi:hypothetical protein
MARAEELIAPSPALRLVQDEGVSQKLRIDEGFLIMQSYA